MDAPTPLGAHAQRLYQAVNDAGEGAKDFSVVFRWLSGPTARRGGVMAAAAFKAAREFPAGHRTDYAKAYAEFRWPTLEKYNFALDWFDAGTRARGEAAGGPP